jgi:hypothetical protein
VLVQADPCVGPASQTPVQGVPGDPAQAGPDVEPLRQIGHGCVALPVTTTFELSDTLVLLAPVPRSRVPLAGVAKVFATQVESAPFLIGSGGPKLQPVLVQSKVAPADDVGPSVQLDPVQLVVKRLVAPSGVGPSGTVDCPPPMLSPPQVSDLIEVVPVVSLKVLPQTPPATPVVKSRNDGPAATVVVVVELVVVVVVGASVVVVGAAVVVVVFSSVVVVVGDAVVVVVLASVVVVVVAGTHAQPAVQISPGGQRSAPDGELGSHGSPGSTTPLPHVASVVVVVGVVVVVVVVARTHMHPAVQVSPGGQRSAPDGELGSHGSPGSTTPLPHVDKVVVVVVDTVVVVVVGPTHVHAAVQVSPGGQRSAPDGELKSHGSPGSTTPLPHVDKMVVVVVPATVVVVVRVVDVVVVGPATLHSGGYGANSGTAARSVQSALNSVTQSTHVTTSCSVTMGPAHAGPPSGTTTFGHVELKPIWAGVRSSPPPQALSGPPHALQMFFTFVCSACWMVATALESPGSGHGFECRPFRRESQHFCSAFDLAWRNFVVSLPIAR